MSEKPYYETMYILRPDIPEEEVDSHLKKYTEILETVSYTHLTLPTILLV